MQTTQVSLARPCTTNHHASKRRAAVWSALLSVLILTGVVLGPAVAAPPPSALQKKRCERFNTGVNKTRSCSEIATEAANKVKEATMSDSQAQGEFSNVLDKCKECRR